MLEWQETQKASDKEWCKRIRTISPHLPSCFLSILAVFIGCAGFSSLHVGFLIAASRVYSVDEVHRLPHWGGSQSTDCRVWAQQLWHMGLAALWCVEYSWMKDQTYDLHCRVTL